MNLVMVLSMLVCVSLLMSLCIFTVSNASLMLSSTVIVRPGDCFWFEACCDSIEYVV